MTILLTYLQPKIRKKAAMNSNSKSLLTLSLKGSMKTCVPHLCNILVRLVYKRYFLYIFENKHPKDGFDQVWFQFCSILV